MYDKIFNEQFLYVVIVLVGVGHGKERWTSCALCGISCELPICISVTNTLTIFNIQSQDIVTNAVIICIAN